MANLYGKHLSQKATPQTEEVIGKNQVQNNAGGFVFQIDDFARLNRFLILGSEGSTYYVGEHKMTVDNAQAVIRCIKSDGVRTVNTIVEISHSGRAPKNDASIFALALVMKFGNDEARKAAYSNLHKVCRIGTHLFQFLNILNDIEKPLSRGLKSAVQNWYTEKDLDKLAMQVIKYREREGFSHRDALRLCHATTKEATRDEIFKWIAWRNYSKGKNEPVSKIALANKENSQKRHGEILQWTSSHYKDGVLVQSIHPLVDAFERAQKSTSVQEIVKLIAENELPREAIPTDYLNTVEVWEALLPHMPMTAMIRNLGKMSEIGLLKPLSEASKLVMSKLADAEAIKKARVHPIAMLSALRVYGQGHGFRSDKTWNPVQTIVDALDEGFYIAFGNVEPTGKNIMLSLDVSGSMGGGEIAGVPDLTPRDASGAMAMVTARVEKNVLINGFSRKLIDLPISGKKRLDDVIRTISNLDFSHTDCALPMLYAAKNKLDVDAFFIYTDNQTWVGQSGHPFQALKAYRKSSGRNAKEVVVGMTATEFSIADPSDGGMMDVVGFDTASPQIMSDFIKE